MMTTECYTAGVCEGLGGESTVYHLRSAVVARPGARPLLAGRESERGFG